MNQYTGLTAFLIKNMFNEDTPEIPDGKLPVGTDAWQFLTEIRALTKARQIDEAENRLFDAFDKEKPYIVRVGLEFYNAISKLS